MNQHFTFPPADAVIAGTTAPARTGLGRLRARIAESFRLSADYYAAAQAYEQLSRLSDAELHRQGLARVNLARDVCAAFDRTGVRR